MYEEDLLKIEEIIKDSLNQAGDGAPSININITLNDRILKFNSMEEALENMYKDNIESTNKIEISAISSNKIIRSKEFILIKYFSNYGSITVEGENEIWVKGLYKVLLDEFETIRRRYFNNKYYFWLSNLLVPVMAAISSVYGVSFLFRFANNTNLLSLIFGIILLLLTIFIIIKNGKGELFPFVKVYFRSKDHRKKINISLIVSIATLIATIVIGIWF